MREGIYGVVALVGLFAVILLFKVIVGPMQCDARWPERNNEWGLFSGCLVETDGRMIPEDRVWFERNQ